MSVLDIKSLRCHDMYPDGNPKNKIVENNKFIGKYSVVAATIIGAANKKNMSSLVKLFDFDVNIASII